MQKASPRQLRQLDFISQFTTSIVHVAGIENTTADALSRISTIEREIIEKIEDFQTRPLAAAAVHA